MIPKNGSQWISTDGSYFHVLGTIEIEGKIWVHYQKDNQKEPQEYSCYLESFLERYKEIVNDSSDRFC
jgi:hypothetical protein